MPNLPPPPAVPNPPAVPHAHTHAQALRSIAEAKLYMLLKASKKADSEASKAAAALRMNLLRGRSLRELHVSTGGWAGGWALWLAGWLGLMGGCSLCMELLVCKGIPLCNVTVWPGECARECTYE